MSTYIQHIQASEVLTLATHIEVKANTISKQILVNRNDVTMVLFAVDKHAGIAKHSNPGDAFVQLLEGEADITIDETVYRVKAGETIILPATIPHALRAVETFKMLLTIIKPEQ